MPREEIVLDRDGQPQLVRVKGPEDCAILYHYREGFWNKVLRGNRGEPIAIEENQPNGSLMWYEYRKGLWPGLIGDRRGEAKGSIEGCFLSTACVHHAGMQDDCRDLRVLRSFRERYVRRMSGGEDILHRYYSLSPALVRRIDKSPFRQEIWARVRNGINEAVNEIDSGNPEGAFCRYSRLVLELVADVPRRVPGNFV